MRLCEFRMMLMGASTDLPSIKQAYKCSHIIDVKVRDV
jgi:hypothetical protein